MAMTAGCASSGSVGSGPGNSQSRSASGAPDTSASAPDDSPPATADTEGAPLPAPLIKGAAGLDRRSLQSKWWTWAASSPPDSNPINDSRGDLCARHQPADVWFLAGTAGRRNANLACQIPAGRPIAFPVSEAAGNLDKCNAFMATAAGNATLDGHPVPIDSYQATMVDRTAVAGNPFGLSPGTSNLLSCGLWAQLAPLTSGSHVLVIRGTLDADNTITVTYTLSVQ